MDAVTGVRELELDGQRPAALRRLSAYLAEEGLTVGLVALFVLFWAAATADMVAADTWLTMLGGREISQHGIPHTDSLALMSHGHAWIDQQWLAQVVFWQLYRLGGLQLTVLGGAALLAVALALCVRAARRRGASPLAIVPFAVLPSLSFTSFVRAQMLSQLLFVLLLLLLIAEGRRPSRRVLLAFPVLMLWANVHGAVVEGAALVSVLGACEAVAIFRQGTAARSAWLRPVGLLAAPWLCLLATPYGTSVLSYYRSTLGSSALRATQQEWMPPTAPSLVGLGIFPVAAAALYFVGRRRRDLTSFELGALGLTLAAGLLAERSIVWFAYAALILVPALATQSRPRAIDEHSRCLRRLFGATTVGFALVAVLAAAASPRSRYTRYFPDRAPAAVQRVVQQDPRARVFASYEYGDWLLFEVPALRGRIAHDGRWEVLTQQQILDVWKFLFQAGETWAAPVRGYRVLVLNPRRADLVRFFERQAGTRVLFRDKWVVVLDRGPAADTGAR